jgi:hypothetical protein
MSLWEYLWSFVWWTFTIFIWVAALMVLIWIIIDIFRDHKLGGGFKALWLILIFFLPLLGAIIYVIVRGKGMAERSAARQGGQAPQEADWQPKASSSPTDDIAAAKALLDTGAISQGEFDALKSKALGNKFYG